MKLLAFASMAALLAACQSRPVTLWESGDPMEQGWAMAGPGTFVAEGYELKAEGGMGLLWHCTPLENFRLELQWKVAEERDNSGIFVRFPDPGDDPWVAVNRGYELQICDTGGPKTRTGSVYDIQGSTEVPTRPVGEWNDYRIEVVGQKYTVTINGKVVNEFVGDRRMEGHIGLQNHDADSPVRFRNIRVTRL